MTGIKGGGAQLRVALYARVSTRDKDQNPETQLYALRAHCQRLGWEIAKEYVDTASAGNLRDRTAWRRLLDDVRLGGWDTVVVLKLDRAFRSVKETYDTLGFLEAHRKGFVAATQPVDTTTSTGKLILGVLASVAEFERDIIAERVKEGMARARSQGKHVGRPKGAQDKRSRRRSGYFARYSE